MEMYTCRLVAQLVIKIQSDLLTNVGRNCWRWPLVVDPYDWSFMKTIRVPIDPGDIPVVDGTIYVNSVGYRKEDGGSWEHHDS